MHHAKKHAKTNVKNAKILVQNVKKHVMQQRQILPQIIYKNALMHVMNAPHVAKPVLRFAKKKIAKNAQILVKRVLMSVENA